MFDARALRDHFRDALPRAPQRAYRDWFRAQEELRGAGREAASRALADDLWEILPTLTFASPDERARFFHNVGVFFGTPGPAADLSRARTAFAAALAHFAAHGDDGWRARALHNLATAISNLGASSPELAEAAALFTEALAWRTSEREIARAVTLHNLGLARRRWSDLDRAGARAHLEACVAALREAAEIRERLALAEGLAATRRALEEALERLGAPGEPGALPGRRPAG